MAPVAFNYQKLALLTESVPTSNTLKTAQLHSYVLPILIDKLHSVLSEADFDYYKRDIFYQKSDDASPLSKDNTVQLRTLHAYLGILSELKELLDIFKSSTINVLCLKEELGDLLWYIALLADTYDLTLEDVAASNIRKLSTRYKSKLFDADEALNRNLADEQQSLT